MARHEARIRLAEAIHRAGEEAGFFSCVVIVV
jgi:hypothetical protein